MIDFTMGNQVPVGISHADAYLVRMSSIQPNAMQSLGVYAGRQAYWLDYNRPDALPEGDWICMLIADQQPGMAAWEDFTRNAIKRGILELKAHGKFGALLHDLFDETMLAMEVLEGHNHRDVITTWHQHESLADTFWQCFHATALPSTDVREPTSIVCTDLDGIDRSVALKAYLQEFEQGWIPGANLRHEVWEDAEGLTTLCLADARGDACRALLETGSRLIHTFYAASRYAAMQRYYALMDWGDYTTDFEVDKEPYPSLDRAGSPEAENPA